MSEELNFQGNSDRLPPQNIEVEEAILGGILLDPEAISRVSDRLVADAFYISAHKLIYQAAVRLHTQGKPTDLLSVTSWLSDNDLLNRVGGRNKLASLVDRTVSAINIDALAALVTEKYLRRQLIKAGNEIVQLGFETETELPIVLDKAEQKVFGIAQERPSSGLTSIEHILTNTYDEIAERHQGVALPGIPCGFYDLDAMTSGFQRSDLIIVAGRPSMGKCLEENTEIVLSDGSVSTIKEIYQSRQAKLLTLGKNCTFHITEPSAFVDDGIKPVFRVTTRLGRFVETTITHPYLTINGWQKLQDLQVGDKIAVPGKIDVFGIEKIRECEIKLLAYLLGDGNLTNSNPRFTNSNQLLQADFSQAVADFGGVTVRMETSNGKCTPSYNVSRDWELVATHRQIFAHEFTESLSNKSISVKEVSHKLGVNPSLVCNWKNGTCVPNLETFEKLRQLLNLESGELIDDGFTSINKSRQNTLTLWLKELGIWGKNAHDKFIPSIIFKLEKSQVALFLNCLFATDGWAKVLQSGQSQLGYCTVSEKLARQIQHLLLRFGIIATLKKRSLKYKHTRRQAWQLDITDALSLKEFIKEIRIFSKEEALLKIAKAVDNLPFPELATSDIYWDEIVDIEPVGNKQVYDLTIPETHNFVANDICVHNTAFCLNLAHHVATVDKLPVAIFSLEMSKEQLVQRLLAAEAKIETGYLRSGRISQNQWDPLINAISVLSEMPIFIDDTPNITVTEMRSQARRLQSEMGDKKLGLVIIDYLQLMEGAGDNRVQELSRITRNIKGLARELNVPVIALSQLSRGVEARTNKRPMLSDLRESGCLTGDSLVILADSGLQVPIRELVGKSGFAVWALNETTMKLERAIVSHAFSTGIKRVFSLKTLLGRTIQATGNHKFLTIYGWRRLDELSPKQHLCLPRDLPDFGKESMIYAEANLGGERTLKVAEVVQSKELVNLANSDVYWDEIVSIEPSSDAEVFDLTVPGLHNFVANNIIVHNSIEQDADLVIMLYRDDYYNSDTPDRGIAEVIIAKHRNGPTGTVKLLFDPQLTRFKNLAGPH
ncbi:MAG: replicative DNA helicase [Nostocaceae cyanobacterium]|nr:replicative DNA helicase [Nostocaceae cyanobacterium]